MDRAEKLAIAIVAGAALVAGGWWLIPEHGVLREPHSDTKAWALVAIGFVALAAPFAIAEGVADRHFRRLEGRLRAERAWERVVAYDGPEGRGLAFEASARRVLLLHPVGGLGSPRVVVESRVVEVPVLVAPERDARAES